MNLLELIDRWADYNPGETAHVHRDSRLTYSRLRDKSDALSVWIKDNFPAGNSPALVYGHKQNEMLIAFLACVKSGRAYIPVDVSTPADRVRDILESSRAGLVIAVSELSPAQIPGGIKTVTLSEGPLNLHDIFHEYDGKSLESKYNLKSGDDFYIIYTSGSTGKPKGVRITLGCLVSFVAWAVEEFQVQHGRVILNQAPFSFDLSVMDLYLALITGGCLWSVDRDMIARPRDLFRGFSENAVNIWVSTPSFAEYCLADRSFDEQLLPGLDTFVFCGEILTDKCVRKLHERFPRARVFNSYGPTEATVAVSSVLVTEEILAKYRPLPIGYPKKDTVIKILDEDGNELNTGEPGEIVIKGPCVSPGYLNDQQRTDMSFYQEGHLRCYRTGDEGYFSGGLLFYSGRKDNQIKLHGYRIELEDIEEKLKSLPAIRQAAVIPRMKEGKCIALWAFVSLQEALCDKDKESAVIRGRLGQLLPEYMVPQRLVFMGDLPLTANGKVNRKQLSEVLP